MCSGLLLAALSRCINSLKVIAYALPHRRRRLCSFERNGDHALTADITGRNLPPRTPTSHWVFVGALDTNKFDARRDIADFDGVLRRMKMFGYDIF